MKRPVIGITMDTGHQPDRYQSPATYATSVEKAGGMPLLLPYRMGDSLLTDVLSFVNGVLFSGGDDLDPQLYGEQRHAAAIPLDADRQAFELSFMRRVEQRRIPTLCICLGCQVLNVHRGGSLIQFIPDVVREHPIEHRRLDRELPRHNVIIESGTLLAQAIGHTAVLANTYHKQAIAIVGRNLRVSARAPDGIIEAVEDPGMPLMLGVQWHPERLHDESEHLALFEFLVTRAREYRGTL